MQVRYFDAIKWIALNDSAGEDDAQNVEAVSGLVTVALIADLFCKPDDEVATDVVRCRAYQGDPACPKKYRMGA